jgi:hypothetical protein
MFCCSTQLREMPKINFYSVQQFGCLSKIAHCILLPNPRHFGNQCRDVKQFSTPPFAVVMPQGAVT